MSLPAFEYTNSASATVTINLTTPLAKDNPYIRRAARKDSVSKSGERQSSFDYIEEVKDIELTFLTETERDNMLTMFDDTVGQGNTFKFIPDQDVPATFDTVTLLGKNFSFEREAPGLNKWGIKFQIRKEVS